MKGYSPIRNASFFHTPPLHHLLPVLLGRGPGVIGGLRRWTWPEGVSFPLSSKDPSAEPRHGAGEQVNVSSAAGGGSSQVAATVTNLPEHPEDDDETDDAGPPDSPIAEEPSEGLEGADGCSDRTGEARRPEEFIHGSRPALCGIVPGCISLGSQNHDRFCQSSWDHPVGVHLEHLIGCVYAAHGMIVSHSSSLPILKQLFT